MTNEPYKQYRPSPEWGAALVVTCLALGFALSWGTYEVRQRLAQEQSTRDFRHQLDLLVGQQSDLGHLLADPRTHLVRLTPVDGNSMIRFANVAWNNESRSGALFCDGLATDEQYQILLVFESGTSTAVLLGPTGSGRTVYPLSAGPGEVASPLREIILNDPAGGAMARGKFTD